jgi:hypothetical protein
MQLAILDNEIAEGNYKQNNEVPIEMSDSEKTQYSNDWRTYRERNALLTKHRGQAFSLILGQCTQLLQDRMKQDTDWNMTSMSYNPLELYRLIKKMTLAQTEDQYPFATVYNQDLNFYSFQQETMSNPQWYKKFNTKVDVGLAISITRQHKVLLEYVAQENHTLTFAALSSEQKQAVGDDAEERYISYAFLRQSGAQHDNLKVDLRNDFTTSSNQYPKIRQQTLHLLDKYSKTVVVPKMTSSEGSSFAQKGGRGGRGSRGQATITFNKEYWKDKTCFNCGEKGHPSSSCTKAAVTNDDDSACIAQSVKKLAKDTKNLKKKAFTQLQKTSKRDSDLSGSESDEEDSHFQFGDGFQFTQMKVKQTAIKFEPRIAKLFKQTHGAKIKLDLKKVILLDSQSTMDLICDPALVESTFKSSHSMRLKSNGGTMKVKKQAIMPGYHAHIWYNKKAITNILSLRNVIKQYRVTYDSNNQMFVVHREPEGKPEGISDAQERTTLF